MEGNATGCYPNFYAVIALGFAGARLLSISKGGHCWPEMRLDGSSGLAGATHRPVLAVVEKELPLARLELLEPGHGRRALTGSPARHRG